MINNAHLLAQKGVGYADRKTAERHEGLRIDGESTRLAGVPGVDDQIGSP